MSKAYRGDLQMTGSCPSGLISMPRTSSKGAATRNLVERFFNKLKLFRVIATRFDKHDANYCALVKRAAARI